MVDVFCCGCVFSLEVKGFLSLFTANKYVLFMEFGMESNSIISNNR